MAKELQNASTSTHPFPKTNSSISNFFGYSVTFSMSLHLLIKCDLALPILSVLFLLLLPEILDGKFMSMICIIIHSHFKPTSDAELTTSYLSRTDWKVPSLNSHHFTNINPYHTCSQLLSTHLLPPEAIKHPGTHILLVLFVY